MKKNNILEVIHNDDDLLVLNKPAGVLSIKDRYNADLENLHTEAQKKYGKLWIVHRIDRETSGLICFAKNENAHKFLSKKFEDRSIHKIYLALVEGTLKNQEGEIDLPIAENQQKRGTYKIDYREGKTALSFYEVVEQFRHFSLLAVQIFTGRTHQIRVHCKAIGHPLAIDELYGKRKVFLLSEVKKKYKVGKWEDESPVMSRLSLHAYNLIIEQPTTHQTLYLTAPLPNDFEVLLKQLRKYDSLPQLHTTAITTE